MRLKPSMATAIKTFVHLHHEGPLLHALPAEVSPLSLRHNLLLKRAFDMLVSLVLITTLLSWMIPLLAVLIRLGSPGPVFFIQKRNRKDDRTFPCIKFRTMVVNAESDIQPAVAGDPRITRIGRFLRNHHLDELPQLFNVLLGHMSLIGPRPYMLRDNILYGSLIDDYRLRHRVKPGITGLAQASGHFGCLVHTAQMQQRLELDLQYIREWSFRMDLRILYGTIFRKPIA